MLRQIICVKIKNLIYKYAFGKGFTDDTLTHVLQNLQTAPTLKPDDILNFDYFGYRICYIYVPKFEFFFMFVSDLADEVDRLKKHFLKALKEFMSMFEPILDQDIDPQTLTMFDAYAETVHKNLRAKISLVGYSGVGKTTILQLIQQKEIPMEHVPTITGDIGVIKIGKTHFHLWDFAGQEQFSYLWNNFIKGSDAVLLITDSSIENVDKSRFFVKLFEKEAPYARVTCIANKQDLPGALTAAEVEKMIQLKTYPMVAIDVNNQTKMMGIISELLELQADVGAVAEIRAKRDKLMQDAEKELDKGDFVQAQKLFEDVANMSLDRGENKMHDTFKERAKKIQTIIAQSQTAKSAPKIDVKDAPKPTPATVQPPPAEIIPPKPKISLTSDTQGDYGTKVDSILQELKLKMANITKMEYDLEMQNVEGKLSDTDYKVKLERLNSLKAKIEAQMKDLKGSK